MSKREHKYMFWTDLETTGSALETNALIEVGAVITDMALNVMDSRSYVVHPGTFVFEMNDVVRKMHTKNGLLSDIYNKQIALPKEAVDLELSEWIRAYNGSNHMLFAGSGVMHFDRQYIRRDLPLTDARLTYFAIDVGVIRRTFELLLNVPGWPEDGKTHRALDDILFHIEEMKWALDRMREGVYNT